MPRRPSRSKTGPTLAVLAAGIVASTQAAADGDAGLVDFDLDVRPILSRTCFECHGPDAEARRAEVRVDTEDGLLGDFGVVVPGDPDASLLFERITHGSPKRVMPPPEARHQLSPDEIETIRRWIEQGAEWKAQIGRAHV